MNYNAVIRRVLTTDGEKYIAFYPKLKGAMGGGDTALEALKSLELEAKSLIEFMIEEGEDMPSEDITIDEKEYSGRVTLRLGKSIHKKVAESSKEEEISLNQWILDAVAHKLGFISNAGEIAKQFGRISDELVSLTKENLKLFTNTKYKIEQSNSGFVSPEVKYNDARIDTKYKS